MTARFPAVCRRGRSSPARFVFPCKKSAFELRIISCRPGKNTLEDSDADAQEEWIVIDCPPNLDEDSQHAIKFADVVVVPVRSDFFSLSNLGILYSTAKKLERKAGQLPLVKIGYDNSAMSKIANQIISERDYTVAEELPLHKRIPFNIASGIVWSTGLTAVSRKPYERLFGKIVKAVEKMSSGAEEAEIKNIWSAVKKEEETENADI